MKRALIAVAAALLLSGCETATPYQPLGAHNHSASGGYSEQQIEPKRPKADLFALMLHINQRKLLIGDDLRERIALKVTLVARGCDIAR